MTTVERMAASLVVNWEMTTVETKAASLVVNLEMTTVERMVASLGFVSDLRMERYLEFVLVR